MPRDTAGERVIPDLLLLLPMFSNPSVTACHLPYMASPHPAMLRGTAEEECKVTLYSFAMSRGRGYFTPLLYIANAAPRSITGCFAQQNIEEVARSDGRVK